MGERVNRRVGRRRAAVNGVNHFATAGLLRLTEPLVLRSEMVGGKAMMDCLKRPISASVGSRREPVMRMRTWLVVTGDFNRMSRRWPTVVSSSDGNFLRRGPRRAVPRFNGKGFNSLAAMIHGFLQGNDIERDRLRQRQGHRAVGLPRRGFPPGVEIAVQRERRTIGVVGVVGGEFAAGGESRWRKFR